MDTGFLLGGGLAFLIAILGWGDQIRGTQERIFGQERLFIRKLKLRWKDVRASIRETSTPAKKLASILRLLGSNKIQDVEDIELMRSFSSLDTIRTKLEKDYKTRFQLVLISSIVMIASGISSTILTGRMTFYPLSWDSLYTLLSLTFITLIMFETIVISNLEENLRAVLQEIEDSLRVVEDSGDQ